MLARLGAMAGHWLASGTAAEGLLLFLGRLGTRAPACVRFRRIGKAMIQANKAFGHGRGACMGLGLDELAVIEHHLRETTDALEAYFSK